jgi:hypothetical protein
VLNFRVDRVPRGADEGDGSLDDVALFFELRRSELS